MEEAQANLKQAAVDFLAAAETAATAAANSNADPLDGVSTDLFELGDLEPVISREELDQLKKQLSQANLAPATIVELVALARQVATALANL